MSEILEDFHFSHQIKLKQRKTIKWFHIFYNFHRKHNVFYITAEDKVYSFGNNKYGVCGFGHELPVLQPREVKELRERQIVKMVNGEGFVLAMSSDCRLFGWGANTHGQLARREIHMIGHYKPVEIMYFIGRNLVDVKCGLAHCMALTTCNRIFCWGSNTCGQVGIGQQRIPEISTPRPVNLVSRCKVKSISCGMNVSIALLEDGHVYIWGSNSNYMCGMRSHKFFCVPRLITNLAGVVDIGSSYRNTYAITGDGTLYMCGAANDRFQKEFKPISGFDHQFKSLLTFGSTHSNLEALALTDDGVYQLVGHRMYKTDFKTFSDYCQKVHQITVEPICLTVENRLLSMMSKFFNNHEFHDLKFKLKKCNSESFGYIYVQKWFITESVSFFRGMFGHNWLENQSQSQEVEIKGYSYEAYYQFLRWLYTDYIDATDVALLFEMLHLSEEYLMLKFRQECVNQLKKISLNKDICDDLQAFAVLVRAKELENLCLKVICEEVEEASETDSTSRSSNITQKSWWKKINDIFSIRTDPLID